jgi:hypothetical protein
MDEEARRLAGSDDGGRGIVGEGPDVPVALERAGTGQPGGAPAEAGHAEPLEALGERPELVDPERLARAGHVVLTHGGDDTRDPAGSAAARRERFGLARRQV